MIDVLGAGETQTAYHTGKDRTCSSRAFEPGMTKISSLPGNMVAASQLFLWRKQYREGSLIAVAAGRSRLFSPELKRRHEAD